MTFEEYYCLGLVAEECGEVLQQIGKAFRFGLDTPGKLGPDGEVSGETPRTLLPAELGDLQAAIDFLTHHGVVDRHAVLDAYTAKFRRLIDPASIDNLGRPLAPRVPGSAA